MKLWKFFKTSLFFMFYLSTWSISLSFGDEFLDALLNAEADSEAGERYFSAEFEKNRQDAIQFETEEKQSGRENFINIEKLQSLLHSLKDSNDFKPQLYINIIENQETEMFWRIFRKALNEMTKEYKELLTAAPQQTELWKKPGVQSGLKQLLIQLNRASLIAYNSFKDAFMVEFKEAYEVEGLSFENPTLFRVVKHFIDINRAIKEYPETHPHLMGLSPSLIADIETVMGQSKVFSTQFSDYSSLLNLYTFLRRYYTSSIEIPQQVTPLLPNGSQWVDTIQKTFQSDVALMTSILAREPVLFPQERVHEFIQGALAPLTEQIHSEIQEDIRRIKKNFKKNLKKRNKIKAKSEINSFSQESLSFNEK